MTTVCPPLVLAEMVCYLRRLVEKYGLEDRGILRLRTRVLAASWDEGGQRWQVVVWEEEEVSVSGGW